MSVDHHVLADEYYKNRKPGDSIFKNHDLRIARLDIRDHIENARNIILASFPQSEDRNNLLMEMKRICDLTDNL